MARTNDSRGPDEPKRKRHRKGAIVFTALTPKQQESIERIAQAGGQIAVSKKGAHEVILKAVNATFDDMVADNEGEAVVATVLSALCASATLTNAKRIAQHPDCPDEVREEVADRIAAEEAEQKGSPPPGGEGAV